mgnify:CR=1 FL=1
MKIAFIVNSIRENMTGVGFYSYGLIQAIIKNNPNPQTMNDIKNQMLPDAPTNTPTIPGISGNALGNLANNLTAIPGVSNNSALMVQSALQGNKTDPMAVAAAFGVNQAQIAGLSPNLTSVLEGKLQSLTKSVPPDTDLNTAVNNGVSLRGLNQSAIAALPRLHGTREARLGVALRFPRRSTPEPAWRRRPWAGRDRPAQARRGRSRRGSAGP